MQMPDIDSKVRPVFQLLDEYLNTSRLSLFILIDNRVTENHYCVHKKELLPFIEKTQKELMDHREFIESQRIVTANTRKILKL